ncbi:MAG: hypothetical protein J5803_00350 [Desulfovibrio sp.]|nr:hypothetical protein [Desulfovibrio sp.]
MKTKQKRSQGQRKKVPEESFLCYVVDNKNTVLLLLQKEQVLTEKQCTRKLLLFLFDEKDQHLFFINEQNELELPFFSCIRAPLCAEEYALDLIHQISDLPEKELDTLTFSEEGTHYLEESLGGPSFVTCLGSRLERRHCCLPETKAYWFSKEEYQKLTKKGFVRLSPMLCLLQEKNWLPAWFTQEKRKR